MTTTSDVMGLPPGVPPVPAGPGVQPPFVAPPTDGSRRRRWVASGLAAATVLVLCLGGAAGLGALAVLTSRVISDEARASVEQYLGALRDADYNHAYDLLCDSLQSQLTRAEFTAQKSSGPHVSTFQVTEVAQRSTDRQVTATITYLDGPTATTTYNLVPGGQGTTAMEVCGPY